MLDRTLAEYGPETAEIRTLLKQLLAERIGQIWPEEDGAVSLTALGSGAGIDFGSAGSLCPVAADGTTAVAPIQRVADHQHDSGVAMDDHRTDRQPVSLGILRCRRGLAERSSSPVSGFTHLAMPAWWQRCSLLRLHLPARSS